MDLGPSAGSATDLSQPRPQFPPLEELLALTTSKTEEQTTLFPGLLQQS